MPFWIVQLIKELIAMINPLQYVYFEDTYPVIRGMISEKQSYIRGEKTFLDHGTIRFRLQNSLD